MQLLRRVLGFLLLFPACVIAAYPEISSFSPNGGQRGTDVQVTVNGKHLQDFDGFIFMSAGFKVKSVDKVEEGKVLVTVSIAPDAALSNHYWRVRSRSGVSHARQFFVSRYTNVTEKEPNDDINSPQGIAFDQTIEGLVKNEDVDYYRLKATKGQRIALEMDALRLGYGNFDSYIAVLDKNHYEIAASDDTILHRQDGYLSVVAPEDGDYTIMVRESAYRGSGSSFYRLHVGSFQRPDVVYPAGGKVGSKIKLRFIEKNGDAFEEEQTLPTQPDADAVVVTANDKVAPPSGNPFRVVAFDHVLEQAENDSFEKAEAVPAEPIAINGIIEKPGDVDFYKLSLKKGLKLELQTFAQTHGSPLDSLVNLYNEKHASLAGNDDGGGRRRLDSKVTVTVPEDGTYFLRITDHLERGGPNFVYRMELTASQPSVKFASPNYSINDSHLRQFIAVPRGGRYATLQNITRNSVNVDMKWHMPELPAGVKLLNEALPKGMGSQMLLFEASKDAPLAGSAYPITLKSQDPKTDVTGYLSQEFDLVRNGNVIFFVDFLSQLPVAVVEECPFDLEIEKPAVPLVASGVLDIKVKAKRKGDYKQPIRVLLNWKPDGVSALGEQTIAKGQDSCTFTLDANSGVTAQQWQLTVMGESDTGKGRVYNAAPWCELRTEAAYLTAPSMKLIAVEQGSEALMVATLEHARSFNGEAVARIVGLNDTVHCEPIKITKDSKQAAFTVKTTDKTPVGKQGNLYILVAVPVEGGIMQHRIALESTLRVDAPRKKAAEPAPKPQEVAATPPAKPAAPPAATAKPLSRLEQLRSERTQK
jgi:hypothetical protein